MLSIFAIPKAFTGHFGVIQRNAIVSWTKLKPTPEIILIGNDAGTAEIAAELGLKHVKDIDRNEYGTPLLSSIFERGREAASHDCLMYINSDIILLSDFMETLKLITFKDFLFCGQRWNYDLTELIAFENANWESTLRQDVLKNGIKEGPQAIDYFVFTRKLFAKIPPFAIGRTCWDNWLLLEALRKRITLIDATPSIVAVHQNHDYSHHPDGRKGIWEGPERDRNEQLLGGRPYAFFTLNLADWIAEQEGLKKPIRGPQDFQNYVDLMNLARPGFKDWIRFKRKIRNFVTLLGWKRGWSKVKTSQGNVDVEVTN